MTIRNGLIALIAIAVALITVAVMRALPAASGPPAALPDVVIDDAVTAAAVSRLSQAIQIQTISWGDARDKNAADPDGPFAELHAFLERAYPGVHRALERETVNGASLIYRWKGANDALAPIALAAHLDVVPIEAGTEEGWPAPPFSGAVRDGVVWGRGALDDKGSVIALMEAAERLIAKGFAPSRDIYFLFGHDEELGGARGAGAIIEKLEADGVRLAWTLDEGSAPVTGVIPGFDGVIALISLAEKGSTTLKLTASAEGGHSSTPSQEMAAAILAEALVKLADNPHPYVIDKNVEAFLHAIAPYTPFTQRLALKNLWLFGGIVKSTLASDPVTAATLHTTTAITIVSAGTKTNILPQQAEAFVNYRIHPRDTPESVKERAAALINDERVAMTVVGANPASPVSSREADGYGRIESAIRQTFGDIVIAPSLTLQGTDQRHYAKISDDAYRFFPFVVTPEDLSRIHGSNERITVENFARGIAFYEALIEGGAQ